MLEIKTLKVSNYYSIGEVELSLQKGLHYIVGINKDIETISVASNGAGKTAIFSAIYQGLFNKNIKNPKGVIESVNNSVTGKPYSVEITFSKEGDADYKITNDRNNNKITIERNSKEIQVKGIANQLKQIKDIIGLDFETFSALTYISQSTLQAILDTTNKDNILYQFFNVETIHKAEGLLKDERKELKNTRNLLIARLRGAEKNLSILTGFERVDLDELESNLKILTESLLSLTKDKRHIQVKMLSQQTYKLREEKAVLNAEGIGLKVQFDHLQKQQELLSQKICPVCGSDTEGMDLHFLDELITLEKAMDGLREELREKSEYLKMLEGKLTGFEDSLRDDENSIVTKINQVKSKILVVSEQNSQYEKIKFQKQEIESDIASIYSDMGSLDKKLGAIEQCINLIKNGALVNEYLNKFRKVFVSVLKELMQKTDFGITINVSVSSGKLSYRFFDRGIEKGFNDLSAGEKTRVSLVLLISTIFTLEKVTGFSSNYLVIDEMLGVLDEEGIEMIKKFLEIIRQDKAVYLITHHNEIPIEFFDSTITFIKEKGITSLQKDVK
jgi:DNA repair exonuclease SbcCD ATPase subunit